MAKNINRKVTIYINGKEVENTIDSVRKEVRKLRAEQAKCTIGSEEYIEKTKEIRQLDKIITTHNRDLGRVDSWWDCIIRKMGDFGNTLSGLSVVGDMYSSVVDSFRGLAEDAAQLDDTYADVMKTTGLTKDSIESLNKAFQKMNTRTSREELNKLAYEAGKLGISTEESVKQFVSASDKINVALGDVLGDDAMVQIGKLSMIYERSTKEMQDKGIERQMLAIGSAINMLGQSSTANEKYMIDFMGRLGGVATQAGLSADQILGFASALDQDMQKVEMSATAFQTLIQKMIQKPEQFAKTAGKSVKEFSTLIKTDMNEAVMSVLKGFQGQGGYDELVLLFKDLGLDGARAAQAISSLTNSIDKVSTAQAIANRELTTGKSVLNEFEVKNNSLQAQQEKALKKYQDMRIELGQQLYPIIIQMTKSGTAGLKLLSATITAVQENKVSLSLLAGAALALSAAKIKSIAATKLQASWLAKLSPMRIAETVQTKLQSAAEARLSLQRAKAELATTKQKIAIYQKIIANKAELTQKGAIGVVMTAENQLRLLNAKAIVQQTAVTKSFSAAMKATPWGAIAAGLLAITAGVAKLYQSSSKYKLNKALSEAQREMGGVSAKSDYLFDKLEKLTEGTQEYKDTLSKLNDLYPDIIGKYTDEEGKLRDIAKARKEVSDAIRDNIYEKTREAQLTEHAEDLAEKQGKAYGKIESLVGKFYGEEAAGDITADIIGELKKNLDSGLFDMNDYYSRADMIHKTLDNFAKIESGTTTYGRIFDKMQDYISSQIIYEKRIEEVNKRIDGILGKEKETVVVENEEERQKKKEAAEEAAKVAEEMAEQKANKIKAALESVRDLIKSISADALPEMEQGFAKIEDKTAELKEKLLEAYGVSSASALPDNARKLLDELASAETQKKAMIVSDMLKKSSKDFDELQNKFEKKADNKFLSTATAKIQEFEQAMADIASKLNDLERSKAFVEEKIETAVGDDKESLQRSLNDIVSAIEMWNNAKRDISDRVFSDISFSVDNKFKESLSNDKTADVLENQSLLIKGDRDYALTVDSILNKYDEMLSTYNDVIEAKTALAGTSGISSERKKEIEDEIELLKKEREELEYIKEQQLEIAQNDALTKMLDRLIDRIQTFGDLAIGLFDNINNLLSNIEDSELQKSERLKDEELNNLEEQLNSGLMAEEEYNEKKHAIEEEFDAKSRAIQLEQFEREKALAIAQAAMAAAVAILRVWSDAGNGGTVARLAQTALVGAATAVQVAAIANQPEPFAKGGYVKEKTFFMAGEAGEEWVANNSLLRDSKTAPIISALERYQRGDRSALAQLSFPRLNYSGVRAAVDNYMERRNFTPMYNDSEIKSILLSLSDYMKDPKNRQAVISRSSQNVFEQHENFLRNAAKI